MTGNGTEKRPSHTTMVVSMMQTTTGTTVRTTSATRGASLRELLGRGLPPASALLLRIAVVIGVVFGAAMIVASAAIHLHLWRIGFRQIHLIGPSFLAQFISGFILAPVLLALPRVVTVVSGALYLAGSVAALLTSATVGFLGQHESLHAPWVGWSLISEIAGAVVLAACALAMMRTGKVHSARQ
jgi:hypothetical protein